MVVDLDTLKLKTDPIANFKIEMEMNYLFQKDPVLYLFVGEVLKYNFNWI